MKHILYLEKVCNQCSFFTVHNVLYLSAAKTQGDSPGVISFYKIHNLPLHAALVKAATLTEPSESTSEIGLREGGGYDDIIGEFAKHYEEVKRTDYRVEDVIEEQEEDEDE